MCCPECNGKLIIMSLNLEPAQCTWICTKCRKEFTEETQHKEEE
jgi:hypothetical protein